MVKRAFTNLPPADRPSQYFPTFSQGQFRLCRNRDTMMQEEVALTQPCINSFMGSALRALIRAFAVLLSFAPQSSLAQTAAGWSGCYAGASLGFARTASTATDSAFTQGPNAGTGVGWNRVGDSISLSDTGPSLSLSTGCDRQFDTGSGSYVLGGVADATLLNGHARGASAIAADTFATVNVNYAASARLRAGLVRDKALIYVTGGIAQADVGVSAYDRAGSPGPGRMDVAAEGGRTGWVLGAGAEWQIAPNRTLELLYLHYDFGSMVATGAASDPAGAFPRFEHDIKTDMIRIGLNWRF